MKKVLLGSFLSSVLTTSSLLSPVVAQPAERVASQSALLCEATLTLAQGVRLSYRLTGTVSRESSGQPVSPPVLSNLMLRVERRNPNGTTQTIVQRGNLLFIESIAPDADYSLLPFSGHFRGNPNDGRGIYHLNGSVHGLYVSLRPLNDTSKQIQVVHYLGNSQFFRSSVGNCRVTS